MNRSGYRLRRGGPRIRSLMTVVAVAGLVFAMAAPAAAGEVHKEMTKFAESFDEVIPAGEVCDFAVGIKEGVKGSETAWFDSDDNLIKVHIQVNGTTEWSGPGGTALEHWAWSGWFDPVALTFSQSGNVWNVHQNGLVIHDKGLIIFDDATGEVLKVAGPHEVFFNGLGALCDAIG
jgi:hypothetical protein